MENNLAQKQEVGVEGNERPNISIVEGALAKLKNKNEQKDSFSEGEWLDFESSVEALGFSREEETSRYFDSLSMLHGEDVIVRRTDMSNVLSNMENGEPTNIKLFDSEPNATLLGRHVEGIGSALQSGFGWVVDGKVAGLVGFTNDFSQLSVKDISIDSPSRKKENGDLMKCISGNLLKEDIIFSLFRIHKSVFPESLLEEDDYENGSVKNFIIRLYKKNRQTH